MGFWNLNSYVSMEMHQNWKGCAPTLTDGTHGHASVWVCFRNKSRSLCRGSAQLRAHMRACMSHLPCDCVMSLTWMGRVSHVKSDFSHGNGACLTRHQRAHGALGRWYGALVNLIIVWDRFFSRTYRQTSTNTSNMHTHLQTRHNSSPRCTIRLFCGDMGLFCRYTLICTRANILDLYTTLAHTQYAALTSSKQHGCTHTMYIYIYIYVNIYLWMRRFQDERTRCLM